jgi:hypothetical protein
MKKPSLYLIIICLLLLAGLSAGAASAQDDLASWTFLMYMTADNDLEPYMMNDLAEIAAVGSTNEVNIVVQVDRAEGFDDQTYGSWTDARRFLVTQGIDYNTQAIESLGETNTGDPRMLREFLVWGISNFPAEKYALFFSNHGGGWNGLGPDFSNQPGTVSLPEITQVLTEVRDATGVSQFEILGFDACLMSQIDVLDTIAPFTRYSLAAEELVPGNGFDYVASLSALAQNPEMDGAEFGTVLVDSFLTFYSEELGWEDKFDLHVINTDAVDEVLVAMDNFSNVVETNPSAALPVLGTARANVEMFGSTVPDGPRIIASADLKHLMELILDLEAPPELDAAAQGVIDAVDGAVTYSGTSDGLPNANGISIYFPFTDEDYALGDNVVTYPQNSPANLNIWREFLSAFHTTANNELAANPPNVNMLGAFTSGYNLGGVYNPPVVMFETVGEGLVSMQFEAYRDGETPQLIATTPLANWFETGTGRQIADYPSGISGQEFLWNARQPYIYDNDGYKVPAVLWYPTATSTQPIIEGWYAVTDSQGNELEYYPASLVVEMYQGYGEVTRVVSYVENEYGFSPFEIEPVAGDHFYPHDYFLGDNGFETRDGQYYVEFGAEPLTVFEDPVPTGTYALTISVGNMAGEAYTNYTVLDVNNDEADPEWRGYSSMWMGINLVYPDAWGISTTRDNGNGTTTEYLSDPDGDIYLWLNHYYYDDAQQVYDEMTRILNDYAEKHGEITPYTYASGHQGWTVEYTYTDSEGNRRLGELMGAFVPENGYGFVIDLDYAETAKEEALSVADTVRSTASFFQAVFISDLEGSLQPDE